MSERESLSLDIDYKSGEIGKLLDDNTNLSLRLKAAQKEAQALLRLADSKRSESESGFE